MGAIVVSRDDFNRADASSLGANWTTGLGGSNPAIASNRLVNRTTTEDNLAYRSAENFLDNQYAQMANIQRNTGTEDFSGVIVRGSASDFVTLQLYQSLGKVVLTWYNGGVYTILADEGGVTGDPQGKTFRLEVVGFTYTCYLNGVVILTATNTSTPSTGRPGVILSGSNVNQSIWDNFEAGSFIDTTKIANINGGKKLRPLPFAPGLAR